ncbi:transglycosylase domain-containing protein [bacterium]|nr:transglycosylase domain-containing protein [bacterium]
MRKISVIILVLFLGTISKGFAYDYNTPLYQTGSAEALEQAIEIIKKSNQETPQIPSGKDLKPGKKDSRVSLLRKRLVLSGDLSPDAADSKSDTFDKETVEALIQFQRRHGIYDNGILGPESLGALNTSLDEQISKAQYNLDRIRTLSSKLSGRYILVNIPDYRLQVVDNGNVVLTMKVVAGRNERPSPTLDSSITHLILNPEWRVPASIAVKDKLPLIQKDPDFLNKNDYKVYNKDEDENGNLIPVDPSSVDWQNVSTENFPYLLVQGPGDLNPLGHIKFMFPNNNDVYLHDTPDKDFFNYPSRNFSSGCIRLEKPFVLAQYLLSDNPQWDEYAIEETLKSDTPKVASLKTPIPVHIAYITAWAGNNNQIEFRPDVYKYDNVSVAKTTEEAPPAKLLDSLFTTSLDSLPLGKLKYILPSFIQITPESTLNGSLKWNVESLSLMSVDTDMTITGVRIQHPGLASRPVMIPDLSLRGTITWDRDENSISFTNVAVGRNNVWVNATGRIVHNTSKIVDLHLSLADSSIQDVLDALPADLIPKLKGTQVAGTIGFDTVFYADSHHPEATRFEPGIRINNYALLQEPANLSVKNLKYDFMYSAKQKGVVVRQMDVSPSNPNFVPLNDLGSETRQAILKAEDINFFSHSGFNLEAIRQAIVRNVGAQGYVRGGSTITQQLAKNLFLSGERTLSRKIQEAMITYAMEQELTKERMFEIYTNIIEWGVNVYGVAEASDHYFSKSPATLTKAEATQMASIIPNPQKRDFIQNTSSFSAR